MTNPHKSSKASGRKRALSIRVCPQDKAMIDRAALQCGQSRSAFVRDAAVHAAERALLDRVLVHLSPAAFTSFLRETNRPAKRIEEIARLFGRPMPWDAGQT